ncbi:MAG: hypothetical protein O2856_09280 [Planctomycetota bacterium]|nr:hypothetical protein [Planctomycetota bacterium]
MNRTPKTKNSSSPALPIQRNSATVVHELPATEQPQPAEDRLSADELQKTKDEKLAVIRRALENGDYDSDAILEKALDRMLERLVEADN